MTDATNVSVGKPSAAGGIFAGDTSVAAPTDATTALPSGLSGLGYVSDEGLTNTIEIDTTDIIAWVGTKFSLCARLAVNRLRGRLLKLTPRCWVRFTGLITSRNLRVI